MYVTIVIVYADLFIKKCPRVVYKVAKIGAEKPKTLNFFNSLYILFLQLSGLTLVIRKT